jgi:C1A family cysteine protease
LLHKLIFLFSLSFFLLVPQLLLGADNGDNAGIFAQTNQSAGDTAHFGVTSHRATAAEFSAMKNYAGTYNAAENYSQVIGGHGTGLRAPTEQQWTQIASEAEFVDQVAAAAAVSSSVDQSKTPYFPPVGNQGKQGSCVAWSFGYYTKTFQEAQEHSWDLSAAKWQNQAPTPEYQSMIMSPAFIYNLQNNGNDSGLYYSNAVDLICNIGCCTYDKMRYNVSDYFSWPSEEAWSQAASYRGDSSGVQYLPVNTDQGIINLKNWIASGHLATISVDADKFSNLSSTDVWTSDAYVNPDTNHANTVVGYDDNLNYTEGGFTHFGAFKIANSWGVGGWENVSDGFYWMSYEAMKQSVTLCMFYNDVAAYTPSLFALFSVSHPLRGECQIQIGVGNPKTATVFKNLYQYLSGGNYPFCSNKIVLDITEFKTAIGNVEGQSFYMAVYDSGTSATGTINSFAINNVSSIGTPLSTVNGNNVYVYASLPSPSPTPTLTPTATPTPTVTPSPTPTPTINPTPQPTPTTTATPTPTAAPTQTTAPASPTVTTQPTTHPTSSSHTKTTPPNTPTNQQTPVPTNTPTPTPTTTTPVATEDAQSTAANYPVTDLAIASVVAATLVVGLAVVLRRRKRASIRNSA